MITLRLAVRLALNRGLEQRWRQVCAIGTALVATVLVLTVGGLINVSLHAADVIRDRSPIWAQPGDPPTLEISLRGVDVGARQAIVVWLNPTAGHESDPAVIPPGLSALPGPGEAVLSPGLVERGLTATSLGFVDSDVGLGAQGAIGPDGVISDSDPWMYVRPAAGRTLGEGGALLLTRGYAGSGEDRAPLEADPDIPSPAIMGSLLVWLVLLPSLFLLTTGARALSPIRAERARLLHRLGISQTRVRVMLGLETAVLAGVGTILGVVAWAGTVRPATRLPLTGAILQFGALDLPAPVVVAAALIVVGIAALSGAFTLASRRARARLRPASLMRTIPLAIGLVTMLASRALTWDAGLARERLLIVGAIIAFASVPLAVPPLAGRLGEALSRTARRPALWLAGRRLTFDSATLTRPATAVGMLVLVAGAAFSMYANMITPEPEQLALDQQDATLFTVEWRDPRGGDLATFTQAVPDSTVYPLLDTEQGAVVTVARCAALEPLGRALGLATACDAAGEPSAELARQMNALSLTPAIGSPPPDADAVLLLDDTGMHPTDIMARVKGRLPALNISEATARSHTATTVGWLISGWVLASLLLMAGILREIGDRALQAVVDDSILNRVGLSQLEISAVERFSLTVPLAVTIPIGYLGAVAYAVVGYELGLTVRSLLPITAVAVAAAAGALGTLLLAHHAGQRVRADSSTRAA